jgi:hypothetical protein
LKELGLEEAMGLSWDRLILELELGTQVEETWPRKITQRKRDKMKENIKEVVIDF